MFMHFEGAGELVRASLIVKKKNVPTYPNDIFLFCLLHK